MAKPTIMQSLLGRPSQTYSFPQEKAYYSTKRDMLRIATETQEQAQALTIAIADNRPEAANPMDDVTTITDHKQLSITDVEDDGEDDSDSDRDVFYTPNTSPRTSMVSSIIAPLKTPSPRFLSTKTSLTHANTSTTSISSSSLDAHSLFSITTTGSTRMTTPVQSDSGHHTPPRVKPNSEPPQNAYGYVDREWARDVRWLVPSAEKSTTTPRRRNPIQTDTAPPPQPRSQTRTKPNTPISKTISKTTPSIMSSMTALLEEDELQDLPHAIQSHHPRSSVLISTPRRAIPRARMASTPAPPPPSLPKSKAPSTSSSLHRRRSRSLGHASGSHASTTSSTPSSSAHTTSPPKTSSKYASSSADPYDAASTSRPTFTPGDLPSQGTPGYTSLVLPRAPVPLSQVSQRPKGIFSLGAGKDPFSHGVDASGKVDLTRSGVAQTTMASVEVVRGLSGGASSNIATPSRKIMGLFRRSSATASSTSAFGARRSEGKSQSEDGVGLGHPRGALEVPLGFTSYREPPTYVPSGGLLVQVWAVGVDSVDRRLVFGGGGGGSNGGLRSNTSIVIEPRTPAVTPTTPKRSASLRSTLGRFGAGHSPSASSSPTSSLNSSQTPITSPGALSPAAGVGYIPGRSFVGRILECGWEVGEEVGRRGDWVVGLLDVRKCGALTEFVIVDRHRVHRVPHPRMEPSGLPERSLSPPSVPSQDVTSSSSRTPPNTISGPSRSLSFRAPHPPSRNNSTSTARRPPSLAAGRTPRPVEGAPSLALEELALLPLCGIPAYRAVRTLAFAFAPEDEKQRPGAGRWDLDGEKGGNKGGQRRRVLVLGGHDGAGGMAVQMLVKRGWRVCVHVPFTSLAYEGAGLVEEEGDGGRGRRDEYCMRRVEERVRLWGGEEVIFDDGEDGQGEDERGAVVRVIDRLCGDGDVFDAVLDTMGGKEVWEASERLLKSVGRPDDNSMKKEKGKRPRIGIKQFTTLVGDVPGRTIPTAGDNFKAGLRSLNFGGDKKAEGGKVGYAWVSMAQDVDWEGENVRETLGAALRTAVESGVRPWVGENDGAQGTDSGKERVVAFEKAPEIFVNRGRGVLTDGGTVVVKVVG